MRGQLKLPGSACRHVQKHNPGNWSTSAGYDPHTPPPGFAHAAGGNGGQVAGAQSYYQYSTAGHGASGNSYAAYSTPGGSQGGTTISNLCCWAVYHYYFKNLVWLLLSCGFFHELF